MDWSRAGDTKEPFVALVPGEDVPLIDVDIPAAIRGFEREKILRRRVKDQFGLSAEQADLRPFGAGSRQNSWNRALLGDPKKLAVWREAEGVARPNCRAVLPDYLGLPTGADIWVVSGDANRLVARFGPADGASGETDLILAQMALLASDGVPKAIFVQGDIPPEITDFGETHNVPICNDIATLAPHTNTRLQVFGHGELSLDLRQEPRAAEVKMRRLLAAWRLPVVLGLFGAAGLAASLIVQTQGHEARTDALRGETVALLRQNLVPTGPILDIPVQVTTRLQQLERDNAPIVRATPALVMFKRLSQDLGNAGLIEARFERGSGMEIDVELASFAAVDGLIARLLDRGFTVRVVESSARDGGVFARINLRVADPKGGQADE